MIVALVAVVLGRGRRRPLPSGTGQADREAGEMAPAESEVARIELGDLAAVPFGHLGLCRPRRSPRLHRQRSYRQGRSTELRRDRSTRAALCDRTAFARRIPALSSEAAKAPSVIFSRSSLMPSHTRPQGTPTTGRAMP
jgi:hypothetical protein